MLKIRDDLDLKELEKFGFKPKYNEDNGKIYKYVCEKEIGDQNRRKVTLITVMKDTIIEDNMTILNIMKLFLKKNAMKQWNYYTI